MGARLLRVNLLAPITCNRNTLLIYLRPKADFLILAQSAIDARLDTVEELVKAEDKFNVIKDALKTVNKLDLDKLISSVIPLILNKIIPPFLRFIVGLIRSSPCQWSESSLFASLTDAPPSQCSQEYTPCVRCRENLSFTTIGNRIQRKYDFRTLIWSTRTYRQCSYYLMKDLSRLKVG